VGIIDRLQEKGLVNRARDSKDRRVVYVTATQKGRDLVGKAPSLLQDRLAEALKTISEKEQKTITTSLERIVDLMEARSLQAAPVLETGPIGHERERKTGDSGTPGGE
jgi:DNA-binding MarR family transcriptional regulator